MTFNYHEEQVLQHIVRTILDERHIELLRIRVHKTRVSFYLRDVSQDEMAMLDQNVSYALQKYGWFSWRSGTNVLSIAKD